MNKQEAIEKIKEHGKFYSTVFGGTVKMVPVGPIIDIISQIHEPQKVVVPKFVGEWIDTLGKHGLFGLNYDSVDTSIWDWVNENYDYNIIKLHLAYLYGYEVEKEKLYMVELFNGQPLVEANNVLYFSSDLAASNVHVSKDKLESAGFGWVFECDGVEFVEVE